MALGYLLEPFIQVNTIVGTPVVGAKIYVYKANTTNLAVTYNDFEGHLNTNPVRTNTLGNCTIIADDNQTYDIEIRDALNILLMSKKNISIVGTSGQSSDITVDAGYGIEVTRVGNTFTVAVDTDLIATQDDLNNKQDKLTAGDNISIENNTVSVVNRRELVTEYPIKLERGNNRVKVYLDDDYGNQFKTTQSSTEYGGETGKYISYISQNENGEIEAMTDSLPQATTYTGGTGIIVNNDQISVNNDVALKSNISIDSRTYTILNETHTLTAEEITNKSFSITIPGNILYWTWADDGSKFTSKPIANINIAVIGYTGAGEVIYSYIRNVFDGGSSNIFASNQQMMYSSGLTYIRTWLTTKPGSLDYQSLDISWSGNTLSEGDRFIVSLEVQASQLVVS